MLERFIVLTVSIGIVSVLVVFGVRALDPGQRAYWDRMRSPVPGKARASLHDVCELAPVIVNDREVRRYSGTVANSRTGRWAFGAPGGVFSTNSAQTQHDYLLVRVADTDLVLQHRLLAPPPTGAQLAFCAVPVGEIHFWPHIGYRAGLFGTPEYGVPEGPYPAVKWIKDTDS